VQAFPSKSKGDANNARAHASNVAKEQSFWERLEAAFGPAGKNWSQAELSRKSGVRESTLTHWKKGDSGPSAAELANVSKALGVSMDILWGLGEPPPARLDTGRLSKPEHDLVVLYRSNERFRRIVNNIIAELNLSAEEP